MAKWFTGAATLIVLSGVALPAAAQSTTIDLGAGGADAIYQGPVAGARAGYQLDQGAIGAGDARADLIVGAPGGSGVTGKVFILFGGPTRSGTVSLSTADVIITGAGASDSFGAATAAGNIFATEGTVPRDLVVAAPDALSGRGIVYVFAGGFTNGQTLSASDARFVILGQPGDHLGTALATGDLDNDGFREVIIGAPGNSRVYIVRGGSGVSGTKDLTSSPADATLSGSGIGSVLAAGEVTGDGIYDLLVGRPSANFVYLFVGRNGSLPTLADATFSGGDAGDQAGASIRILDIDADGQRDVVIGAPGGDGPDNSRIDAGEAHVLFGGPGLLTSRDLSAQADVTIYGAEAGMHMGTTLTAGDINRDSPNDLVLLAPGAAGGGQMYVYYGRPRADMGPIVGGRHVVDFATTSPSRIVLGDSSAGPLSTGQVFEVTGEGARDLIIGVPTAGGNAGAVYFTTSPRMLATASSYSATIERGQTGSTTVTLSNPSTIAVPWSATTSDSSWLTASPASGTISEGHNSVITIQIATSGLAPGTYSGTVSITSNTEHLEQTVTFNVSITVTAPPAPPGETGPTDTIPGAVPAGTLADGLLDFVWQNQSTGELAAWNMDGTSLFDAAWLSPKSVDTHWHVRAVADFNRDGKPDLIWQHDNGTLAVWFMNGTSVLDTRLLTISSVTDPNWRIVAAADLNNDLRADLIWQNTSTGDIAVWLMWDNQVLDTRMITRVSPAWRLAAAGDLNRDNKPDFIFQHTDGTIAVWFMDGFTIGDTRVIAKMGDTNWKVRAVRDMNNDLRGDLIFQHETGGWLATWFMWDNNVLDTRWLTPNRVTDLNWKIVGGR